MKQVVQSYKNGEVNLFDVPVPTCKSGGILVHNVNSLISAGTEKLMIETGRKSLLGKAKARPDLVRRFIDKARREGLTSVYKEAMNRLDEPIALGYSSAGVVLETNDTSTDIKVGDRVACVGAGFASHAEIVWVPDNLYTRIPDNVGFDEAAFTTLGSIAMHGIRSTGITFGENVAVIGLGVIGLLTVQILEAYGCNVIALDIDKRRVSLAKMFGAQEALVVNDDMLCPIENLTKGYGVDAVIITAACNDSKPVQIAENICRKGGKIVLVGVADLHLTRSSFWEKELIFRVSKASGPGSVEPVYEREGYDYPINYVRWTEKRNMEHFVELLSRREIDVKSLISHRFEISDASKAYDMITNKKEPYIGILLNYSNHGHIVKDRIDESMVTLKEVGSEGEISVRNVGFIGWGMFTKNILLPAIKKVKNANLIGIATTTGISSHHVGRKYGFKYCTSNYKNILKDNSIDSVVIATRHNQHCNLIVESLEAGKHVFIEKPLCISKEELKKISGAYNNAISQKSLKFMVGFNRRYSSLAVETKSVFEKRKTPLVMIYRVNAGYLQPDHWAQNPDVGGGRIIGEICHYIDFFQYITEAYPKTLFAESISGDTGKYLKDDNVCLTVKFSDGSIGTIIYSSAGTKAFSREKVEIFGEETAIVIDDFRELVTFKGSRKKRIRKRVQDVGYVNELNYFLNTLSSGDNGLFKHSIYTTLATFKAKESLDKGIPVTI